MDKGAIPSTLEDVKILEQLTTWMPNVEFLFYESFRTGNPELLRGYVSEELYAQVENSTSYLNERRARFFALKEKNRRNAKPLPKIDIPGLDRIGATLSSGAERMAPGAIDGIKSTGEELAKAMNLDNVLIGNLEDRRAKRYQNRIVSVDSAKKLATIEFFTEKPHREGGDMEISGDSGILGCLVGISGR